MWPYLIILRKKTLQFFLMLLYFIVIANYLVVNVRLFSDGLNIIYNASFLMNFSYAVMPIFIKTILSTDITDSICNRLTSEKYDLFMFRITLLTAVIISCLIMVATMYVRFLSIGSLFISVTEMLVFALHALYFFYIGWLMLILLSNEKMYYTCSLIWLAFCVIEYFLQWGISDHIMGLYPISTLNEFNTFLPSRVIYLLIFLVGHYVYLLSINHAQILKRDMILRFKRSKIQIGLLLVLDLTLISAFLTNKAHFTTLFLQFFYGISNIERLNLVNVSLTNALIWWLIIPLLFLIYLNDFFLEDFRQTGLYLRIRIPLTKFIRVKALSRSIYVLLFWLIMYVVPFTLAFLTHQEELLNIKASIDWVNILLIILVNYLIVGSVFDCYKE